jgi:hypothetical protein
MDRKARFRDFAKTGLGFTAEELKNAVEPVYDIPSMRAAEPTPVYGSKKSARSKK